MHTLYMSMYIIQVRVPCGWLPSTPLIEPIRDKKAESKR